MKRRFRATMIVEYDTEDSWYQGAKNVKEMTDLDKLNIEADPASLTGLITTDDSVEIKVEDITPKVATLPKKE